MMLLERCYQCPSRDEVEKSYRVLRKSSLKSKGSDSFRQAFGAPEVPLFLTRKIIPRLLS